MKKGKAIKYNLKERCSICATDEWLRTPYDARYFLFIDQDYHFAWGILTIMQHDEKVLKEAMSYRRRGDFIPFEIINDCADRYIKLRDKQIKKLRDDDGG